MKMKQDSNELVERPGPSPAALRRVPARLIDYAPGHTAALAPVATVALLPRPPVVAVPGAPAHALGLMAWGWRHIPLLDLALLLGSASPPQEAGEHVLVLAWQPAPGAPVLHGAVRAPALLRIAEVGDDQQCDFPVGGDAWRRLASCCLQHEGRVVPVLEVRAVFGG
jgi:chemotaxis signal transduction protein